MAVTAVEEAYQRYRSIQRYFFLLFLHEEENGFNPMRGEVFPAWKVNLLHNKKWSSIEVLGHQVMLLGIQTVPKAQALLRF